MGAAEMQKYARDARGWHYEVIVSVAIVRIARWLAVRGALYAL